MVSLEKGTVMAIKISGSVGLQGRNKPEDVVLVQELINAVPGNMGGPPSPIDVDGLVGPQTIGAIRRFQVKVFGAGDGRVDPNGQTIVKLGGAAGDAVAKSKPAGGAAPDSTIDNGGAQPK